MARPAAHDVHVASSRVLAGLESEAAHALNALMLMQQAGGKHIRHHDLDPLRRTVAAMADYLSPVVGDDVEIGGISVPEEYQYAHPAGVAALSIAIAVCLEMDKIAATQLGMAAALMNLGYAVLRPTVAEQPADFDDDRWTEAKTHPTKSAEMLSDAGLEAQILEAIAQHHERWDGSGYPLGLAHQDHSLFARIIAIADTYVLLRSPRAHRRAMGPRTATDFVMSGCGVLFDPELVRVFARNLPHHAIGAPITLSSGESGIVVDSNVGQVCRPVVRVSAMNGVLLSESYEVDLSDREQLSTVVVEPQA